MTLRLKNSGSEEMRELDVRLHSFDTLSITLYEQKGYLPNLPPNEQGFAYFKVNVFASGDLYASVRCRKGEKNERFEWETPWISARVVDQAAEIESIFVSNPYGAVGKELKIEATVRGQSKIGEGLDLQFWADSPSGKYEELANIKTKELSPGEEVAYTAKITPKEVGYYNIYATLSDTKNLRVDRASDMIWVEPS
ncbi:MAG: hypothetical protein ABI361_06855 [Nitrososphaera sp.]